MTHQQQREKEQNATPGSRSNQNQGLPSNFNDESDISANNPPSPKACEALLASEKLESEATIPRSHKTHKTSSFVKVGQNKEKSTNSFNSFLKNIKQTAAPENSSTLTANTMRL